MKSTKSIAQLPTTKRHPRIVRQRHTTNTTSSPAPAATHLDPVPCSSPSFAYPAANKAPRCPIRHKEPRPTSPANNEKQSSRKSMSSPVPPPVPMPFDPSTHVRASAVQCPSSLSPEMVADSRASCRLRNEIFWAGRDRRCGSGRMWVLWLDFWGLACLGR
jgi:hypothetical protein